MDQWLISTLTRVRRLLVSVSDLEACDWWLGSLSRKGASPGKVGRDRRTYMREYMRRRRGSKIEGTEAEVESNPFLE